MEKVTMDKNYNPIRDGSNLVYQDHLFDTVEEIKKSLDDGKITQEIANMLLQILINKEAKKESEELVQWVSQEDRKKRTSVFINISNNHKKYA